MSEENYKDGKLEGISKRYYEDGKRSPNEKEREIYGYSKAWLHHKGRNKHHLEYWIDYGLAPHRGMTGMKMPVKYVVEMVMDRIAACKVYRGSKYDDGAALDYLQHSIERELLHDKTRRELVYLLTMLKEKGEKETFDHIKNHVLQGKPFPWEETEE